MLPIGNAFWGIAVNPERVPAFIGQEIKVSLSGELRIPVSFRFDARTYQIEEILDCWQDYGFGRAAPRRRRWWNRHHRNYYRVKTDSGEVYELYHERGTSLEQAQKGKWFLSHKLH